MLQKNYIWQALAIAGSIMISAYAYLTLPSDTQIAIHWNFSGQADNWLPLPYAAMVLPGLQLILALVFAVIPKIEPRRQNLQRSSKSFHAIISATQWFLTYLHGATFAVALGWLASIIPALSIGLGLLLCCMGNFLGKVKSNFMVGIRTPWTLSSDEVWYKTHRLGGWLFFSAGAITILTVFIAPSLAVGVGTAGALIAALVSVIYSYLSWRQMKPSE